MKRKAATLAKHWHKTDLVRRTQFAAAVHADAAFRRVMSSVSCSKSRAACEPAPTPAFLVLNTPRRVAQRSASACWHQQALAVPTLKKIVQRLARTECRLELLPEQFAGKEGASAVRSQSFPAISRARNARRRQVPIMAAPEDFVAFVYQRNKLCVREQPCKPAATRAKVAPRRLGEGRGTERWGRASMTELQGRKERKKKKKGNKEKEGGGRLARQADCQEAQPQLHGPTAQRQPHTTTKRTAASVSS